MTNKLDLSVYDVERQAPVFVRLRQVFGQAGGARDRVALAADRALHETGGRLLVPLEGQSWGEGRADGSGVKRLDWLDWKRVEWAKR